MTRWPVVLLMSIVTCAPVAWCRDTSPSWRLATDDTAVVVTVEGDAPWLKQLQSVKDRHEWLGEPVKEDLLPTVAQGGVAVATHWTYADGKFDRENGKLTLRFVNAAPALELESIWQARAGRGPVEHWLTIANRSGDTITIGHQDSLVLHVKTRTDESTKAWWIKRGGGNASTEGGTFQQDTRGKFDLLLNSDPVDGASPVPWLALQSGEARGLYVGWEFSGLGRIHAYRAGTSGSASLQIETGNQPEFRTDLSSGETFLVPPALVGCYSGDVDDGSYSLHRFVLEKLRPKMPPGYPDPTLAYNLYLDSGGAKATEQNVLASVTLASRLGFETFVVDAMWFPQSGDWRWDPARFPRGSLPIEQSLHSHDMKLGLWMAYTQGSDSEDPAALNVTKHADWFTAPPKLDRKDHINWDAQVDLGSDLAREWVEQATTRAVSEFKLDYFKTDYTPIATKCMQTNHRHHYGVDVSYWSTLGYYAVQDNLLNKFPGLVLEGCSGSGHIKDFGDIQHVHYLAANDTLSSLPDRQGIYDTSFVLPPAAIIQYTYENFYNKTSDAPEPYLWRSSMMNAWEIDPTQSASWTPDQITRLKREVEIYKSWIRPILKDVEVHHILPRPDGQHWDGMFFWSPTLERGTVYIFRPDNDEMTQQIRLKGLNRTAIYKVRTADKSTPDATYSGAVLMRDGLAVQLPSKYSSDLIYLEKRPPIRR